MEYLVANAADLTSLVFAVLGVFSLVAKLTPTEADNKALDKVLSVVHTLGLTKK